MNALSCRPAEFDERVTIGQQELGHGVRGAGSVTVAVRTAAETYVEVRAPAETWILRSDRAKPLVRVRDSGGLYERDEAPEWLAAVLEKVEVREVQ